MKKSLILVLAVLTTGFLALAAAVNVTGTWEMTTVSQRGGERKNDVTFKQDGEKLLVSWMQQGRQGGEPTEVKGEGTVKGNDIEWKITRSTPRGEFTTTYKGTITDDKTMSGKSEMGMGEQVMTQEWKAVKK